MWWKKYENIGEAALPSPAPSPSLKAGNNPLDVEKIKIPGSFGDARSAHPAQLLPEFGNFG